MKQKIKEMNDAGWRISIEIDWDGDCGSSCARAGDSNCPHQKEYDIKDGHGNSDVEIKAEDYPKHEDSHIDMEN